MCRRAGIGVLAIALALAGFLSCPCGVGGCANTGAAVSAVEKAQGCCGKEGVRPIECCEARLVSPGALSSQPQAPAAPRSAWLVSVTANGGTLDATLPILRADGALARGFAPPGTLLSARTLLLL
jgi:hypothetical protein